MEEVESFFDDSFGSPSCPPLGWEQWGRRLEVWPNTAARLAGWRTVCQWPCRCDFVPPAFSIPYRLPCCELMEFPAAVIYVVNVHIHPSWAMSRKEGMAWYSSRHMLSLWLRAWQWLPPSLSHSLSTLCIEGTFSPIFASMGVVGCGPKSYESKKACYSSFQLFHVFNSSWSLPAIFFFSSHVASVAHIYIRKLYSSMNLNCPVYYVKLWCKLCPMTAEF